MEYNNLENALLRWQECYVQLVHCSPTTEQGDAAGRQAGLDPYSLSVTKVLTSERKDSLRTA